MKRSYYSNNIATFQNDDNSKILGALAQNHSHALEDLQKNAWIRQIEILKIALQNVEDGQIYFEFSIPRMGKRVDNVLIIKDLIFVLEFKVGESTYPKYAIEQAVDYSLDLKNFHEGSHHQKILPVLIATKAPSVMNVFTQTDSMFESILTNEQDLGAVIQQALQFAGETHLNPDLWENSIYKPTPTIIEAAQGLYRGHNVQEISRHDAGAINLTKTTQCINNIIEQSKNENLKSICFLTGVPGAGKTLAGLNIANERMKADEDEHAVFLSGNGPLVDVLREALTRDEVAKSKEAGSPMTKKQAAIKANAFIQNIHHFRDDSLASLRAPVEKVVVFDEAQRAWSKQQASSFMKRKKGIENFDSSEPEFLIDVMNRHADWCVVICLIGGGQEINTGEAGVSEWIDALKNKYQNWNVHFSNLILEDENYLSDENLKAWLRQNATQETELHLSVSVRSFRSEKISDLMGELVEANTQRIQELLVEVNNDFPIALTRDLATAKKWLRNHAKGSERIGLVASSGARRLRPMGIDAKNEISAPYWFLNDADDVRSSNFLEDIATEFDIQGLEIDWVCLAWDINFYYEGEQWKCQNFGGTSWKQIHSESDQMYLKNAYRVLLTRARQGPIIYVPYGDEVDKTRPVSKYNGVFTYLKNCGLTVI